ncbi:hypothetical protein SDC9_134875 [bioreactor metagenome]|uniref:Uncharacterized protein n=1 Tax=bioreactor metagenome TaxID=1076179 RepID=A0A645DEY3_9ZZZZ
MTLVVPERSDQARQLFEELLSLRTAENGIRRSAVPDTAVTAEDVEALVAQTPGAVGILAAGTLKDTEKAAAIDAIPFGEDAVRDGSYPLSRPVTLMLGVGAPQAAEEVYRYCLSQSADAAIRAAGFLPPTR